MMKGKLLSSWRDLKGFVLGWKYPRHTATPRPLAQLQSQGHSRTRLADSNRKLQVGKESTNLELGRSCHRGRVFLFVCFYIDRSFESCFVAYRGCIGRFVLYHMMSFLPPTCLNGNQLRYTGLCKILEDEMVFLLNMKWVLRSEGFCVSGRGHACLARPYILGADSGFVGWCREYRLRI